MLIVVPGTATHRHTEMKRYSKFRLTYLPGSCRRYNCANPNRLCGFFSYFLERHFRSIKHQIFGWCWSDRDVGEIGLGLNEGATCSSHRAIEESCNGLSHCRRSADGIRN